MNPFRQQTATADVLKVISRSATDVQPVFETIARRAVDLCGATYKNVFRYDGEQITMAAHHNLDDAALEATKNTLGVSNLTVVADAGYSSGTAAAACEADGITACAPTNRSIHSRGDGTMFGRSAFTYQPDTDAPPPPFCPQQGDASRSPYFYAARDDLCSAAC